MRASEIAVDRLVLISRTLILQRATQQMILLLGIFNGTAASLAQSSVVCFLEDDGIDASLEDDATNSARATNSAIGC